MIPPKKQKNSIQVKIHSHNYKKSCLACNHILILSAIGIGSDLKITKAIPKELNSFIFF